MASVFKRKKKGSYIISWFDWDGRRREKSARTIDYRTAKRIADKLEADTALRREGIVDGAADKLRQERARPILDHVADFEADLAARGVTAKHVAMTITHLKSAIKAISAETIDDLTPSAVQRIIGRLRKGELSVRTQNAHLRSIKSFTRWLLQDGRIQADALAHLKARNADTDRRYERRDLPPDELAALVVAAKRGPDVTWRESRAPGSPTRRITGSDRAMLYRIAAGTGFRRGEIASLAPESFNLNDSPPTITIQAACNTL